MPNVVCIHGLSTSRTRCKRTKFPVNNYRVAIMDVIEIQKLLFFLNKQRIQLSDEKTAQTGLADLLQGAGYAYVREKRLSDKDIPDFVVKLGAHQVVIELKIKAQRKSIYRQLERYAQHGDIDALILYTATAMHLPEKINEKPAFVASMGAGWL